MAAPAVSSPIALKATSSLDPPIFKVISFARIRSPLPAANLASSDPFALKARISLLGLNIPVLVSAPKVKVGAEAEPIPARNLPLIFRSPGCVSCDPVLDWRMGVTVLLESARAVLRR